MGSTSIEWTDRTWNPVTGCDNVSPGCDNCYAMTMAKRLKAMGNPKYQTDGNPRTSGPGFGVAVHEKALREPFSWRKPSMVFVNSMSDLFHADIPDEFIARVFAVMAATSQHTYQILTKRHGRMASLVGSDRFESMVAAAFLYDDTVPDGARTSGTWPLRNVWLGVSAEDQKRADLRIPALMKTPAAVRFVSAEPLLGPIDLNDAPLDWLIIGGESGPGARPMQAQWARSLRDQCEQLGIACHFKQAGTVLAKEWGAASKKGSDPAEWPEPFPREFPAGVSD
ncbi:phage Gp37/Gp68 family protein [Nocardia wallacei]|uniref:phage Gp37/Gp68 family protein n=1 Tax=Nocardia wallacei TaxID=480035 RepID=UPI002458E422|nr:phage Gp37/Gp68 family protein [Nocardia wallacei]